MSLRSKIQNLIQTNPEAKTLLHDLLFESTVLAYRSPCYRGAVHYFNLPSVVNISRPETDLSGCSEFLSEFESDYLSDSPLEDGTELVKFAGQLCYLSFDLNRTMNAQAATYVDNIKMQRHGSVLEHANYSFLFYGVSRSFTHELVRHRAGFGFSQLSQRYCDRVRFVERPEYVGHPVMHPRFLESAEWLLKRYEEDCDILLQERLSVLKVEPTRAEKRDLRKAVRQAGRSVLPNCTEAPIVVTANARAWHHFFLMRGDKFAEPEIRRVAVETCRILKSISPILFQDWSIDGSGFLKSAYVKV